MKIIYLVALLMVAPLIGAAQMESKLVSITVPADLKKNANSVIRQNDVVVTIKDRDKAIVTEDRIITVLNDLGWSDINAYQHYSNSLDIKDLRVEIHDVLGNEIKTIKEKDFRDASAVDGGTLYAEDRVKYLEYVPRKFPVTVHYTAETEIKSTAFLPRWRPVEGFYVSVESSSFKVVNESNIPLKVKEQGFEKFNVNKKGEYHYTLNDMKAIKREAYQPDLIDATPYVKFALEKFEMEGVEGTNEDWNSFGKWMYKELLTDVQELPQDVKTKIKELTKNATTDREKAKIVYEFMQDRSRYISVQVGIGGWKPIEAEKVHETAYGDCKGLSNYTIALMKEVGVKANYVGIYGGSEINNMDADFSMAEGNHAIIMLPELDGGDDVWLECTSKTSPFGFIGNFTDDRDALVITPEGGKIMHTTAYPADLSKQNTKATIQVKQDGSATAVLEMATTGVQYAWRSDILEKSVVDTKSEYMDRWSYLNGMVVKGSGVVNDKEIPQLREKLEMDIERYASKTGNLLLFHPVTFNRNTTEPPTYEDRFFDLEIQRGYVDIDEYTIQLEPGMSVDALPEPVELESPFGTYRLSVTATDSGDIQVKRYLKIIAGVFDSSEYQNYREFRANIVKYDNARGVIKI